MSSEIQNIRRSPTSHVTALLLPAIVIPLAVMGVTAPKGLDAHAAAVAVEEAEDDIAHGRRLRAEQERFGGAEMLEVAREYELALGDCIPRERSRMELYTRIREAATRSGLHLTSVRAGAANNIGLAARGTSIVCQEMYLDGDGTLVSLVLFARALYDQGVLSTMLQATLGRDRGSSSLFDIHLLLGIFHVVDGAGAGAGDPDRDVASQWAAGQEDAGQDARQEGGAR